MKSYEIAVLEDYEYHAALDDMSRLARGPFVGYEPPTRCTYVQTVANEAAETLAALTSLMFTRLADSQPSYTVLCQHAFAALYAGDPVEAKRLARATNAATQALRDIAAADVRDLVLVAERAARRESGGNV